MEVAEGLAWLHQNGIAHYDVSPGLHDPSQCLGPCQLMLWRCPLASIATPSSLFMPAHGITVSNLPADVDSRIASFQQLPHAQLTGHCASAA